MHTGILLEDRCGRDTSLLQCAPVLHGAEPAANNPTSRGQVSSQGVPAASRTQTKAKLGCMQNQEEGEDRIKLRFLTRIRI